MLAPIIVISAAPKALQSSCFFKPFMVDLLVPATRGEPLESPARNRHEVSFATSACLNATRSKYDLHTRQIQQTISLPRDPRAACCNTAAPCPGRSRADG